MDLVNCLRLIHSLLVILQVKLGFLNEKVSFSVIFLFICFRLLFQFIVFSGCRGVCLPGVCVHWHGLLTISAD